MSAVPRAAVLDTTAIPDESYGLGRSPEEYERLRAQAQMWEQALGRVVDQVALSPGQRVLDAGCGPGEAMRLLARRVGPEGVVVGVDSDAELGVMAQHMLHQQGHRQCHVYRHDLTRDEPIPGGCYDLVLARLLLFHLPQRIAVLGRLWQAVAPGGHLLVQDYDLRAVRTMGPAADTLGEVTRVIIGTFEAVGADPMIGMTLPLLFQQAGLGTPDGTEVAGRLLTLADSAEMLAGTLRSLLPIARVKGVTTEAAAEATLNALHQQAATEANCPVLWPLMFSAWKRNCE